MGVHVCDMLIYGIFPSELDESVFPLALGLAFLDFTVNLSWGVKPTGLTLL